MKNKKLIVGVGVGVAILLYFIFKSKKGKQLTTQVVEKVKGTVNPKEKTLLYRGVVNRKHTDARNLGKQYVATNPNVFKIPSIETSVFSVPQDAQYFVENSKGERRNVIRASKYGVVIDEKVDVSTPAKFLPKGSSFIIFKESY